MKPQEMSCICLVDGVAIWSIVLMLVPVVTFAVATVRLMGALNTLYLCTCYPLPFCPRTA